MIFSSLRQHLTWTHFLPKFRLNPSYTKLLTKMVDWLIFKIVLVNGFSSWEGVIRPRRTVKVPSTSDFAGRCKFLCFKKNFHFFEFLWKSHKSRKRKERFWFQPIMSRPFSLVHVCRNITNKLRKIVTFLNFFSPRELIIWPTNPS